MMELVSSKVDLAKHASLLVPSPGQSYYHKRGGAGWQQQDEHSSFISQRERERRIMWEAEKMWFRRRAKGKSVTRSVCSGSAAPRADSEHLQSDSPVNSGERSAPYLKSLQGTLNFGWFWRVQGQSETKLTLSRAVLYRQTTEQLLSSGCENPQFVLCNP